MSTPTGIPPAYFTAAKVDNHDKQGTNTSSFFFNFRDFNIRNKALVPELTATQFLLYFSEIFAQTFSIFFIQKFTSRNKLY